MIETLTVLLSIDEDEASDSPYIADLLGKVVI